MFVFPLIAAGIAVLFTVSCWRMGRRSPNPALRVWAFSLAQFAIASGALAWGTGFGWVPGAFRVYYVFGAIWNPAWLALGTVWLLAPRRVAFVATGVLIGASVVAAAATLRTELLSGAEAALATRDLVSGAEVFPHGVRNLSRLFSFGGLAVLAGGLAWSMSRRPAQARGLGLLLAGVLVVAFVSALARQGFLIPLSLGLVVGVLLMYGGFLRTTTRRSGSLDLRSG